MAAKSQLFATNLLKLMYQAVAFANIADNAASSPNTNVYWSLHTADPNVTPSAGDQSTSETTYTGYARQAVARTTGGHAVSAGSCSPVANVVFPVSTSGTPTITHFATGKTSSGATDRWHSGTVTPNIVVSTSVAQTLTTGSTITES
jgi:hypothetical protein